MTKKWLWLVIGAVTVVLAFQTGCGGGSSGPVQDFIVGSWELYAVSSSFSGPKVPAEEFGMSLNITFDADGTWDAFGAGPAVPPEASAGTWSKVSGGYLISEPGETDDMLCRHGNLLWLSGLVDGVVLWAWFCRT